MFPLNAGQIIYFARSFHLVMVQHVLNLLEAKIAEFYYFSIPPVIGGHNLESFFLPVNIQYEPGFMFSIKTTPICVGKKVRPGAYKDLNCTKTFNLIRAMRNFHKIFCHDFCY